MTRRYFKRRADAQPGLGEGVAYFEFAGRIPTRQVERYGDRWFDSRTEYHDELGPGLVDQPPDVLGLGEADEISSEEFEEAWDASCQANP